MSNDKIKYWVAVLSGSIVGGFLGWAVGALLTYLFRQL